MRRLLVLVAIVLAFPAAAFGVSHGWLMANEQSLQRGLAERYPHVPLEKRQAVTIGRLCGDPEARKSFDEGACDVYNLIRLMRLVAVAAAVLGLGWLAALAVAGRLARGSAERLRALFVPGMRITNALVVVMLIMQGALAVATSYLGQAWLDGRVYVMIPLLLGAGALIGIFNVVETTGKLTAPQEISVAARAVPPAAAPALWALIQRLSEATDVTLPDTVLVGVETNAFVTDSPVKSLDGPHQGRTLVLSTSLARVFTREELGSVIGHELAHFRSGDLALTRGFYPIYRGVLRGLTALQAGGTGFIASLTLWPATATLWFFLDRFATAEREIGRGRELVADALAAEVSSAEVAAAALVKTHLTAQHWEELFGDLGVDLARGGPMLANVSRAAVDRLRAKASPQALAELQSRRLAHPFDSHPALSERLEHLGVPSPAVVDAALTLAPRDAAVELLPGVEALEEALSAVTQREFAAALGIQVEEA